MSTEKNITEAGRWFQTAEDDLDSAMVLKENSKHAHACFHAQQAGEKALKSLWYLADADPWGHSIKKLIDDLEFVDLRLHGEMKSLVREGMVLDRFYIPTRYPNGLPDITPDVAFSEVDAAECIERAEKILEVARSLLKRD